MAGPCPGAHILLLRSTQADFAVATTSSSDEQQDEARMNDFFAAIDAEQDSQLVTLEMELLHLSTFSIDDGVSPRRKCCDSRQRAAVVTASLAPSKNLSIFSILPAISWRTAFSIYLRMPGVPWPSCRRKLGHSSHDALWSAHLSIGAQPPDT